jgi:hypothetical protein
MMTTRCLATLSKIIRKGVEVPGEVEIGHQTQKIQSAQGRRGGIEHKA